MSLSAENGIISARIQKKTAAGSVDDSHFSGNVNVTADSLNGRHIQLGDDKTFIVFSGDLDKTIAAFIMANGAASLGRKVTMFFTFWGLNILRRPEKVKVDKSFIEKMFGWMMPRGSL